MASDKAELVREAIEKILYPFQPKADLGNYECAIDLNFCSFLLMDIKQYWWSDGSARSHQKRKTKDDIFETTLYSLKQKMLLPSRMCYN